VRWDETEIDGGGEWGGGGWKKYRRRIVEGGGVKCRNEGLKEGVGTGARGQGGKEEGGGEEGRWKWFDERGINFTAVYVSLLQTYY